MSKHNELEDFVNGLVQPTKIAESDLDLMSVSELEALIGLDLTTDDEKVAYLDACVKEARGDDRYGSWLEQFEGSPLKAKAVQLCEQELALEQQRLQRRIDRDAQMKEEENTWTQQDMLRLQKDMLMLELHKARTGMSGGADPTMQPQGAAEEPVEEVVVEEPAPAPAPKKGKTTPPEGGKTAGLLDSVEKIASKGKGLAKYLAREAKRDTVTAGLGAMIGYGAGREHGRKKKASDVQMVGQVNNGDPNQPEWPRAALGVDSAGRRATAEEQAAQARTDTQVQHREPETGSKSAGLATSLGDKVLARAVDSGAIGKDIVRKGLNAAQHVGSRLGAKSTEQAVGRGLVAAGGAAAGVGAAGAGLAMRKKSAAEEGRLGLPFGSEKISNMVTAARSLTKAKPTQALHALALPKHLAKTNPAQAIQAGRQFGAPVVANSSVLDQLSRTSFDKLSKKVG